MDEFSNKSNMDLSRFHSNLRGKWLDYAARGGVDPKSIYVDIGEWGSIFVPIPGLAAVKGAALGAKVARVAATAKTVTGGARAIRAARVTDAIADAARAVRSARTGPKVGGDGQIFTHYTDVDGVAGIADVRPMKVGHSVGVDSLKFGHGGNDFLARAPGDNFVTDLGLNATPRQLEAIGVFWPRQQYAIQFSHEAALSSGVRPVMVRDNIFTIPGGSCITGACTVTRVR